MNPQTPYPKEILNKICNPSMAGYLQEIANRSGDFKVYTKIGNWTSKRRSVLECSETSKGLWWLSVANYMEVLKHWILIDLDEPLGDDGKVPLEILNNAITKIKFYKLGNFKVYYSGGKGYHIHIEEPDLVILDYYSRQKVRAHIIKKLGADLMLKSEKMTIQIPGAPHRKTLRKKKEIMRCGEWV